MSWLDSIKSIFIREVEEERNLNNPSVPISTALTALHSPVGAAGVMVSVESVLGLSEAWRAVKVLGETVASVPFKVYEKTPDGRKIEKYDHAVYNLFNVEPNRYSTPFTFLESMMLHAALYGNAYAVIELNRRDAYPRSLTLLNPKEVEVYEMDNGALVYKHNTSGKTYAYNEILHIANTSWNGQAGLNVLTVHRDNFSLALANRNYGANFYKNGAQLSGILKHPGSLSKEAMERLKSSWRKAYEGSQNAGRTAILEEGMDYQTITLNPAEASFSETKKAVASDMARIFGVPQFLLEDLERATFNNIEHLSQLFLTLTIRPWCKRIAAEINRKLFPSYERQPRPGQSYFCAEFDFDDLLMADLESRAEYARTFFNMGALSINEVREMLEKNAVEDGDRRFIQGAMADIDKPLPSQPETQENTDVQTLLSDAESE